MLQRRNGQCPISRVVSPVIRQLGLQARDDLVHECFSKIRQLLAKYVASRAKAPDVTGIDRLGYLLYAAELSKGTTLQSEYESAMPVVNATLLAGIPKIQSFELPTNISTLTEAGDNPVGETETSQPSVESFVTRDRNGG